MSGIPLNEAIAAGAWFECHSKYYDKELHYRLKVVAFSRTSVDDIDVSLVGKVLVEGILWLLSVEVVSLCSARTDVCLIKDSIVLIDEDGFTFEPFSSDLDTRWPCASRECNGRGFSGA